MLINPPKPFNTNGGKKGDIQGMSNFNISKKKKPSSGKHYKAPRCLHHVHENSIRYILFSILLPIIVALFWNYVHTLYGSISLDSTMIDAIFNVFDLIGSKEFFMLMKKTAILSLVLSLINLILHLIYMSDSSVLVIDLIIIGHVFTTQCLE